VELSEKAQEYLRENIARHRLQARITRQAADIHQTLPLEPLDLMISNPPYLSHDEMLCIPVRCAMSPPMALEAEEDGMRFTLFWRKEGKNS
jgi:methylase of polypeptide subunit release factors